MSYSARDEALTISRGYRPRTLSMAPPPKTSGRPDTVEKMQPIRDANYEQADPVRCDVCDARGMLTDAEGNRLISADNQVSDCPACDGLGATFPVDPLLPTDFAPGSWQKQLVIQARYAMGGRLFVAGDRVNMDTLAFPDVLFADDDEDDDEDIGGCSSI